MTIILKGAIVVGDYEMPNPLPWWVEHVTQATKEAQRDAQAQHSADEAERKATALRPQAGIEDDAIAQLEADDRFEYTVDELVDLVVRLYADCECYRKLITSGLSTNNVAAVLEAHWINCEAELKRLRAGRIVV